MALTLNTIRELRALILSDRVPYKGNEVLHVAAMVNELNAEEHLLSQAVNQQSRVVPLVRAAGAAPPAARLKDEEDED